jgi:hypothetical protein
VPGDPARFVLARMRPKLLAAGGSREWPSAFQLLGYLRTDRDAWRPWRYAGQFAGAACLRYFSVAPALSANPAGGTATRQSGSPPGVWVVKHHRSAQPLRGQLARRSLPEFQTTRRSREDDYDSLVIAFPSSKKSSRAKHSGANSFLS